MDPRRYWRGGLLGGVLVAVVTVAALNACASAQAAPPRSSSVSATGTPPVDGCGHPGPGSTTWTLTVGGRQRTVGVHVPRGYAPGRRIPLVLNLHGTGSTAARQEPGSALDASADKHTFLVAYPQGDRRVSGGGFAWNIAGTPAWSGRGADDVGFLNGVVTQLSEHYCVDPARVYATGFSGGARMVSQLACDPGGVFAAIVAVGGLRAPTPCAAGTVAVLGVHGTGDLQNPYTGHGQSYWTYSVPEAARRWAVHNGCTGTPVLASPNPEVSLATYHSCRGTGAVELYTLTGKGHQWPPSKPGSFDCDERVWDFLAAHPRTATPGHQNPLHD